MYNSNWNRWIRASVNTHFYNNLPPFVAADRIIVEGAPKGLLEDDTYIEIRMDGPKWREVSKNFFILKIEVNLLLTIIIGSAKNLYESETILGHVNTLVSTIPVFKLGGEVGDDGSQIGCLELKDSEPRDWTTTSDFGQIEPTLPIRQETVEAHYTIEIEGE